MSETPPDEPYEPQLLPESIESIEGELLVGGYDWLRLACHVLSTFSLMLIAITLIARL